MTTALSNPVDAIAETVALHELGAKDNAIAIASRHDLTLDELGAVLSDPEFKDIVARKKQAMAQGPETFKKKARAAADEMLPEIKEMFFDGSTSPSVRKDIYREVSRQAGYSGADDEESGGRNRPRVSLVIDLTGPDGEGQALVVHSKGKAFPSERAAIEEENA